MPRCGALVLPLAALLVAVSTAAAKTYERHDAVKVYANTVGPFNNPSETYPFYSLPFCTHSGRNKRAHHGLTEALSGARKRETPYTITFQDNNNYVPLCSEPMTPEDLQALKDAIEDDYFFEFWIDDLPLWGYLGESSNENIIIAQSFQDARVYLYRHMHFTLGYNGKHIVSANVSMDTTQKEDITLTSMDLDVQFSYSVDWVHEPDLTYETRMTRYVDSSFLPSSFEIHWLSIINSFVLVLLLTAFLTVILMRILRRDFSRYMEVDDELAEEETGWKLINGDVFRLPQHLNVFTALVGAGAQLLATLLLLLGCVLMGVFRATKRGAVLTSAIILYSLCGAIGGFVSGRLYKQLRGTNWVWNIIGTAVAFPAPLLVVFAWVNTVAWAHGSTLALPAATVAVIISTYLFVDFPLTILGGVLGRNTTSEFEPPCRINKLVRQIPSEVPWYRHPLAMVFMSGFCSFTSIYIELHYLYSAVWGHRVYSLFGVLMIAVVMLIVVASFITVALLYFQLAREDHRWWWRSLVNGGATGLFMLGYAFFYYMHQSRFSGLLQLSVFFGYSAILSYAVFLALGSVGFGSSFFFVNSLYSAVKLS
mmetsp:Transcript_3079/g.10615  ORF Transcript_3079/g.10615 Transcript_3079/m.10615 type:complete len:594 (+) Transcript_3079:38-1819(+)